MAMPPVLSTARVRAVEVLRATLERGGRASALLARGETGLSSSDRDLMRQIVLGVLRTRSFLDSEIAASSKPPLERLAPDLREILEVALYQIRYLDRVPAYAAVDSAVAHARASAGPGAGRLVNAVLRTILRRGLPAHAPAKSGEKSAAARDLALRFSHPEFLVSRWLRRFGLEDTLRILQVDNSESPLDLMVNSRKTNRAALAAALLAEGVVTEESELAPLALTVVSGNPLRSPLLSEGHFSVQDIGSQALPLLLPAGDTLVDLAAAPGGKALAALFLGRARQVVALDRSPARLLQLIENRARLDVPDALPAAGDFLSPPLAPLQFGRVLFDAPCSGTGTLRKNPEIRYRVTPQAIERLSRIQEKGLAAAAGLLAPGGYLLYSTCSLEEEENERVVERVLSKYPELTPAPIEAPEALAYAVSGNRFRMLPGKTNDGFTAHLVVRRT